MRSDALLQLGRKIVDELGPDQSVDTLCRWMAHYIAELMQAAEAAHGDERHLHLSRCANAIVDLWKHHRELPNGHRPFGSFEPIMRTLQSLDPDDETPRYFRAARAAAEEGELDPGTANWLDTAETFDYTARILIRYCLACAAKNAVDKSKEWVAVAEAVDLEELDVKVLRILSNEKDLLNSPALKVAERKQVEDRIQRLDSFIEIASKVSSHLKTRLGQLNTTECPET